MMIKYYSIIAQLLILIVVPQSHQRDNPDDLVGDKNNSLVYLDQDCEDRGALIQSVSCQFDLPCRVMAVAWKKDHKTVLKWNELSIEIVNGDITNESTDMIVNSTDAQLRHSVGLAAAIRNAAGASIVKECSDLLKTIGGVLKPSEPIVTSAGAMSSKYICHCNCDGAQGAYIEPTLRLVYDECINNAIRLNCNSISFTGLGTGIDYQVIIYLSLGRLCVPPELSAKVALTNVIIPRALSSMLYSVHKIRFVDSNISTIIAFANCLQSVSIQLPNSVLSLLSIDNCQRNESIDDVLRLAIRTANDPQPTAEAIADQDDTCAVCIMNLTDDVTDDNPVIALKKCGHRFHRSCIYETFSRMQHQCPICKIWYGVPLGNQPIGAKMHHSIEKSHVPGHPDANGAIVINYSIPGGIQTRDHLRPGVPFQGTHRTAYLPNNAEGQQVLKLLQIAFNYRLVFTVGDSVTTGAKNVVIWNNIHHKTTIRGGSFGYPDPTYLDRVKDELASVGITVDMI